MRIDDRSDPSPPKRPPPPAPDVRRGFAAALARKDSARDGGPIAFEAGGLLNTGMDSAHANDTEAGVGGVDAHCATIRINGEKRASLASAPTADPRRASPAQAVAAQAVETDHPVGATRSTTDRRPAPAPTFQHVSAYVHLARSQGPLRDKSLGVAPATSFPLQSRRTPSTAAQIAVHEKFGALSVVLGLAGRTWTASELARMRAALEATARAHGLHIEDFLANGVAFPPAAAARSGGWHGDPID